MKENSLTYAACSCQDVAFCKWDVRFGVVGQWEEDEQVSLAEELSTIHVVNLSLNYLQLKA